MCNINVVGLFTVAWVTAELGQLLGQMPNTDTNQPETDHELGESNRGALNIDLDVEHA